MGVCFGTVLSGVSNGLGNILALPPWIYLAWYQVLVVHRCSCGAVMCYHSIYIIILRFP